MERYTGLDNEQMEAGNGQNSSIGKWMKAKRGRFSEHRRAVRWKPFRGLTAITPAFDTAQGDAMREEIIGGRSNSISTEKRGDGKKKLLENERIGESEAERANQLKDEFLDTCLMNSGRRSCDPWWFRILQGTNGQEPSARPETIGGMRVRKTRLSRPARKWQHH